MTIPQDVRHIFGKREDEPTWPTAFTEQQATAAKCDWRKGLKASMHVIRLRRSATDNGVAFTLTYAVITGVATLWRRNPRRHALVETTGPDGRAV